MIDIIIRDCGHGEFLPIIKVTGTNRELYRGDRMRDANQAFYKARDTWLSDGTGNIAEFKQANGL